MSRRIVTPINPVAFNAAQVAYLQQYPNPQPQPGSRAHRQRRDAWLNLYAQNGGVVDQGGTFQAKVPGNVVEPCPLKNVIASVAFLTGSNPVNANAVQRVNLPQERKFIDGVRVTHRDRLGHTLRAKVTFRRKKKEDFKVALLAHNANPAYTGPERGHSAAYGRAALTPADPAHVQGAFDHYVGAVYTGRTGSDGKAVIEGHFEIPPSGGAKYKLVAWDVNGNVVFSGAEIETKRTLFYATFLADDPTHSRIDTGAFARGLKEMFDELGLELIALGEHTLFGLRYHDPGSYDQVGRPIEAIVEKAKTRDGLAYKSLGDHLMKIVFVDQAARAEKRPLDPVEFESVEPGEEVEAGVFQIKLTRRNQEPLMDFRRPLWVGMGPAAVPSYRPPNNHEWFHAATLSYVGEKKSGTINLPETAFTLVPRHEGSREMVALRFKIPGEVPSQSKVTFALTAVSVTRMVNGEAIAEVFPRTIVVAARENYKAVAHNAQIATIIHEVGHALGMVPVDEVGIVHTNRYTLNGSHCASGAPNRPTDDQQFHSDKYANSGTCVMFGQIPPVPNLNFCGECKAALRKIDLSSGWRIPKK